MTSTIASSPALDVRTASIMNTLFQENQSEIYRRTDRLFAGLMVIQWLAGIVIAVWISPRTWAGAYSETHVHVWSAVVLGGLIALFPVYLALTHAGSTLTRHVIAASQMLTSALLIHLCGGRIEAHFHIFGSLAFLASYRDWRVLITATIVVAADHFIRGIFYPHLIFGVLTASPWRVIEHASWVVFEDIFLCITLLQSVREMQDVARHRAQIFTAHETVEAEVASRTRALNEQAKELRELKQEAEKLSAFGAILDKSMNEIFIVDVETWHFIHANHGAQQNIGYTLEELRRMTAIEIKPEFTMASYSELVAPLLRGTQASIEFRTTHRRKDGSEYPVEVHLETSTLGDKKVFVVIALDITERQKNDAELRRAKEQAEKLGAFGDILDHSLNEIFITDAETFHFVHANHGALANFGYTMEEFRRLTPLDINPRLTQLSLTALVAPLLAGEKENLKFTAVHRRKDGSEFPVEVYLETSSLGEQKVFVVIALDITERQKAELELQRAKEQAEKLSAFGDILDDSLNEIFVFDAESLRFVHANHGAQENIGYTMEELRCLTPLDIKPTHTLASFSELVAPLLVGTQDSIEFATIHRRKDGSDYPVEVHLETSSLGGKKVFVAVILDITERQKTELELRDSRERAIAADRSKSEFLANMSHEIRTPMTAILGFNDLLLDNLTEPENIDAARTVKENGEYLLKLINDILDLSKIESGKLEVECLGCSPREIVAEVASLMGMRARAKNLSLEVRYDGPIPDSIQSDPTRLRQMLINLVGNAIKFTEIGKVQIVTRLLNGSDEKRKLQFDVIDTGIGITEDSIEKIFQPFTQADGSTTRKFGGTGLGLTITKRLTELLGGEVSVSSTVGMGSTFSVTVSTGCLDNLKLIYDAVEAGIETVNATAVDDTDAPLQNCRILLVEDGPDNQRLIGFILKKAGAEVTVAYNGQSGYELATAANLVNRSFDVVLMDMQMPVLDGYGATRKLRNDGYSRPILALTAHAMASDCQKCLDAGCDDFLTKPVDRKKLVKTVESYAKKVNVAAEAVPASSRS